MITVIDAWLVKSEASNSLYVGTYTEVKPDSDSWRGIGEGRWRQLRKGHPNYERYIDLTYEDSPKKVKLAYSKADNHSDFILNKNARIL